jgi:polyisoprenoid-binding protein YceI
MKRVLMLLPATVLSITAVFAQTWKADVSHSRVEFTVTHLMISEVTGRFQQFDATLTQSKDDFSGGAIEAVIKTGSVTTDNEGRDKHLRSDEFFNAEKFPEMKFVSTSFEKTGTDTYTIAGQLTIRDVTKPVVLNAKLLGSMTDPRGSARVGFKAAAVINRMDYGVKWNKSLDAGGVVVSEDVNITLRMEFVKQK